VIVAVTVKDLALLAAVDLVRDLADHLEGLLVGLRTRVGIIDTCHARHLLDQTLGKLGRRNGSERAAPEVHLEDLIAHGIGDAFAAIANVDRPDAARNRIEEFAAGDVPDPKALALDHDARVDPFELLVLNEVVPDVGAVGLDHRAGIVGEAVSVHWVSFLGNARMPTGRIRRPTEVF
jgi:hypothetical protein